MHKLRMSMRDTYTMVSRSMKHTTRHVEILIMVAFMPLMQLLLLVYVFGGTMRIENFRYVDYVLPGILLMAIASSVSMTASSVKEDMTKGIIDRFRTMDIGKSAVLNGHMCATLVRTLITIGIICVVGMLLGFRFQMSFYQFGWAALLIFMFTLMYTWISISWGLFCPSIEAVGAFTYIGMLAPYLSSCFVPTSSMPDTLRIITDHQPFTALSDSLRALFLGIDPGSTYWIAMVWCVVLLIVFYVISLRLFHRKRAS